MRGEVKELDDVLTGLVAEPELEPAGTGDEGDDDPATKPMTSHSIIPGRDDLKDWRRYSSFPLERELKREGLFAPDAAESLGDKESACAMAWASRTHFRFPRLCELVTDPHDVARVLVRAALDPEFAGLLFRDRSTDLAASKVSEIYGVGPADLKDSHLRALLSSGHFGAWDEAPAPNYRSKPYPEHFKFRPLAEHLRRKERPHDPKLYAVAFLISRGLVRETEVETYLPEMAYAEFHRYQSKIHREIESTLPERYKRFKLFWDDLTVPQKKAIRFAYMDRTRNVSQVVAAKQLGISIDALKQRLNAAIVKLKKRYPEFAGFKKARKKDCWRQSTYNSVGLFNYARAKTPEPVTRLDPTSRATIETFIHPKAPRSFGTPQVGFEKHLADLALTTYEPHHDGVDSPAYACMVAIAPPRMPSQLSVENQSIVAERLRRIEAGEEPQVAGRSTCYRHSIQTLAFPRNKSSLASNVFSAPT